MYDDLVLNLEWKRGGVWFGQTHGSAKRSLNHHELYALEYLTHSPERYYYVPGTGGMVRYSLADRP